MSEFDPRRDHFHHRDMSIHDDRSVRDAFEKWVDGSHAADAIQRAPNHPTIELCLKTDSEDGSAIYHPDEMHDPEIDEPWILIEPDGGLVHVSNCR